MDNVQLMANLAEIFGGLAVIIGIGFGLLEYRRYQTSERREAVARLARSFQTKELAAAIRVVMELPEPFDMDQYRRLSDEEKNLVWMLCASMESIGILVFRGDLPLTVVDEFFSIPVAGGWNKLSPYVEELRERVHGPQAWEWYQWLADRLAEHHEVHPRIPAYVEHGA